MMLKHKIGWLTTVILMLWISVSILQAQSETLTLTMEVEQPIGAGCPEASLLQTETDLLWLLMADECSYGSNRLTSLQAFDLDTFELREQVEISFATLPENVLDELENQGAMLLPWMNPFVMTPNGEFILYFSGDILFSFALDPETGEVSVRSDEDEQLNTALSEFTEYPGYAVSAISPGNTYVAASNDDSTLVYVIDLTTYTVLFEAEGQSAKFSADSTQVYVTSYVDPDSRSERVIVAGYSLPDGEPLARYELSLPDVDPSPDGQFAVLRTATGTGDELSVIDLETGSTSAAQLIGTTPQAVTACVNSGESLSDYDVRTTGELELRGLYWLPGNREFITVNAQRGEGFGMENDCALEVSRLRRYSIRD
jgi:hypothetical protein